MRKMKTIDWIAFVITIIGGINWGLVGLFGFDLIATLFGQMSGLARVIYTIVGIAAIYSIFALPVRTSTRGTLATE